MNQEIPKKTCETNFGVCSNMEYICSRTSRSSQKQVIVEFDSSVAAAQTETRGDECYVMRW